MWCVIGVHTQWVVLARTASLHFKACLLHVIPAAIFSSIVYPAPFSPAFSSIFYRLVLGIRISELHPLSILTLPVCSFLPITGREEDGLYFAYMPTVREFAHSCHTTELQVFQLAYEDQNWLSGQHTGWWKLLHVKGTAASCAPVCVCVPSNLPGFMCFWDSTHAIRECGVSPIVRYQARSERMFGYQDKPGSLKTMWSIALPYSRGRLKDIPGVGTGAFIKEDRGPLWSDGHGGSGAALISLARGCFM